MDLYDFIKESNRIENIHRDPTTAELATYGEFLRLPTITVADMEEFVSVTCGAKLRRKVGMDVVVGDYFPPPGGILIEVNLTELLTDAMDREECHFSTHLAYEKLHPFMDGNGRSGRVLWLWMMGGNAPLGFLHEFYYQTLASEGE